MTAPNIILIIADDMGYGDFGVFNDQISCTPTLDALVDDGICLTQHYSASPVCAPARAALMTGRYPHRTGSIDTLEARGLDRLRLDETTLADLLASAGYATGLIGKWHNGALDARYHPTARGFQEFVGFQGGWNPYYRYRLDRNGRLEYGDKEAYLTDVFTEEALAFIDRHHKESFFLQLAYNAPHFPLEAPDALAKKYCDMGFSLGASLIYAMIEVMDEGIGRINERLKEHGIADNTIVIFTSDNGPAFGAWNGFSQRRFNFGWNGQKGNTYEGGIRVPFIAWWPGTIAPGLTTGHPSAFWDFPATAVEAAGLDPVDSDGISFLPTLLGQSQPQHQYLYWEFHEGPPKQAIRAGRWKAVYFHERGAAELYDLSQDISETNDLAAQMPHLADSLVALIRNAHTPSAEWPLDW